MISCSLSRIRANAALRGSGILTPSVVSASPARVPEMRITAMAAGGRPEDRAKMVGRSVIAAQVNAAGRVGQGPVRHVRERPNSDKNT